MKNVKLDKILISVLLISLIPFVIFLMYFENSMNYDWGYFNSFNLQVLESIKNLQFPFIDTHLCGGVDNFANPQSHFFSPLFMFDLIFWQ